MPTFKIIAAVAVALPLFATAAPARVARYDPADFGYSRINPGNVDGCCANAAGVQPYVVSSASQFADTTINECKDICLARTYCAGFNHRGAPNGNGGFTRGQCELLWYNVPIESIVTTGTCATASRCFKKVNRQVSLTTASPTQSPVTSAPMVSPTTSSPTASPTTSSPTASPTESPSASSTTSSPTESPSASPTASPTTSSPTASPTTSSPTESPTASPTTSSPTSSPTASPTTSSPTASPTTSSPTSSPTHSPTTSPTTSSPTLSPTASSPVTAPPVGFRLLGTNAARSGCCLANGYGIANIGYANTPPQKFSQGQCRAACAANPLCGGYNQRAPQRRGTHPVRWRKGDCELLPLHPVATSVDSNPNCRCYVRR